MLMMKARLFAATAAIVSLHVGAVYAQTAAPAAAAKVPESLVGNWTGGVETTQGKQPVQLAIDSSATGWKGTALAPAMGNDPTEFTSISVKPDTIMLILNAGGTDVAFSGWINPDTHLFEGALFFGGDEAGSFSFARVPPTPAKPPAAATTKPPRRD
jgi:hypothetical protein